MSRSPRALAHSLFYASFFCFFCFPNALHAATGRVECNSLSSKFVHRAVRYCVMLPAAFDADKTRHFPILYLLHGLGDNEQFFIHSGEWNLVEDMREKGELKDFLIATPDGGASFYINAKDGKERYEDFLVQEFLPFIEKRYRVSPGRANRAISGISMGGLRGAAPGVPASATVLCRKRAQRRTDREIARVSWEFGCTERSAQSRENIWRRIWQPAGRSVLESGKSDHARADSQSGGAKDLLRLRRSG